MVILDSNIIIYSIEQGYQYLRDSLVDDQLAISKISVLEVLGYHKITDVEEEKITKLLNLLIQLPIDDSVINKAIDIRQKRRMSIGDAVIAATALTHESKLLTANDKDFDRIPGLLVHNPMK